MALGLKIPAPGARSWRTRLLTCVIWSPMHRIGRVARELRGKRIITGFARVQSPSLGSVVLSVLRNGSYAKLFSAQVIALLGTGLLTVALGLLAFDIAGGNAGIVLGTALTIKMVAYVAVSPVVAAVTAHVPRKAVLITADLVRAAVAIGLPFVTDAWQIYILIFLLQAASATFTPAFQAVIPEVLPDEREYTRALSLSRLAYDLESLLSPMIAAALLTVTTYNNLFVGTIIGFLASTLLVSFTPLPKMAFVPPTRFIDRLTRGARIFWLSRELRALLAMNLVVAASTAMVIVNTVVLVQGVLARPQVDVAVMLAVYGAGSMMVALALPPVLDKFADRPVMIAGALILPVGLLASGALINIQPSAAVWAGMLAVWAILGMATSMILTPSARLLRRNSVEVDRPAVFAAQFSLSHACFILTYPLAGAMGAAFGLPLTALTLAALGLVAALLAWSTWRPGKPENSQRPSEESWSK